jgi:mannosyl-3-phosphoglycerate phosphatase family protein
LTVARAVVFTDLDGTALQHDTYQPGDVRSWISRLDAAGVVLVLCSNKTRAEQEWLRPFIGHTGPYSVENGGAVHIPGREPAVFGGDHATVRDATSAAAAKAGLTFRSYTDLGLEAVVELTGLHPSLARLAMRRQHSECGLIDDRSGALDPFRQLLSSSGLRLTEGRRMWTVHGNHDKGSTVRHVRTLFPDVPTMAIGDYLNDVPMLELVDRAFQLQLRPGTWADLGLAGVQRIPAPGPEGWALAAAQILYALGDRISGDGG